MFRFIKKCFFTAMTFFSCSALNAVPLTCVSINNQECKVRPKILNTNSNEPSFCSYSILVNNISGSCNNIRCDRGFICNNNNNNNNKFISAP